MENPWEHDVAVHYYCHVYSTIAAHTAHYIHGFLGVPSIPTHWLLSTPVNGGYHEHLIALHLDIQVSQVVNYLGKN